MIHFTGRTIVNEGEDRYDRFEGNYILHLFIESEHGDENFLYHMDELIEMADRKESPQGFIFTYKWAKPFWWDFKRRPTIDWVLIIEQKDKVYTSVTINTFWTTHYWESQPLIERRENQQKYYAEREKYLQEQLKFNPEWGPRYEKVKSVVEWVPAEKIKYYPDSMGTRTNGCVHRGKEKFKGMSDHEIWTETSKDPDLVKECCNTPDGHCSGLYQLYQKGKLFQLSDRIQLKKVDGWYYCNGDGHHRICLLKRLSVPIYAEVSIYERKDLS